MSNDDFGRDDGVMTKQRAEREMTFRAEEFLLADALAGDLSQHEAIHTEPFEATERLLEAASTNGFDIEIELTVGAEACWACSLRFTPYPFNDGADRSIVLWWVGADTANSALSGALWEFSLLLVDRAVMDVRRDRKEPD